MDGNDSGSERGMVVVNQVPNRAEMITQLFGKRKRRRYQTPDPLPQSVVEALDVVRQDHCVGRQPDLAC
ncbi:MAG: hypothetical protein BRC36_04725 [Cyanobacteria bacterium QH_2_48_84]|nr:MAG: hypothetical protein BRC36_04725 [Cyanobacteria bacterium QH_2_48_84]